jgi:hypothetical protein
MKALITACLLSLGMLAGTAHAATDCAAQSAEKKLSGAAKASFEKKCMKDAGGAPMAAASPACEKSAADKKLHGAAAKSHIKKCSADEMAAGKPMAAAKPAAEAKPMAAAAPAASGVKK